MVLKGYFDGEKILLDEPPHNLPPNTRVEVTVAPVANASEAVPAGSNGGGQGILDDLAKLAAPGGLPADFSEQHSHYTKGAPRR